MKKYRYYVSLERLILTFTLLPLLIMGCANEVDKHIETAKDLYSQSVAHRDKGETDQEMIALEKALGEFQKISKTYPNRSDEIAYYLHQIWEENYKQASYEAASLIVDNLVKNFPKGLWTSVTESKLFLIAREDDNEGRYEAARRAYQELVEKFPNHQGIMFSWYGLGNVNYKLRKYEDARKALRIFISNLRSPNSAMVREARRLIAQSYLDQSPKDYNQAYLNFDKLTTEKYKNDDGLRAEALYKTAYCLKILKVNDEALGRYTEFMLRFPESKYITDVYFDLGVFYAYNKIDYELARFNYNRALKSDISSNHSKAKIQAEIGHTFYNQGDLEKANDAYNMLLQKYPTSNEASTARIWLAHIFRRMKKTDESIESYKSIIEDRNEIEADNVSLTMDEIDEGLPLSVNLIAACYFEIGEAFSVKQDFQKAYESFARIVEDPIDGKEDFRKDPYAPFALYKAMASLCKLGRIDELENFATTYINTLRNDEFILSAEGQLKFADILREKLSEEPKQYDKAAAEYAKLQDYPPKPYLRLNLIKLRGKYYEGLCYEKGETPGKSVESYQEAIRLFDAIFQPLLDSPKIAILHITNEEFDYCMQTALDYAKKIRGKLKELGQKSGEKTGNAKDSSNKDITSTALASTVYLNLDKVTREGSGSGFFVGPGLIATNYHVVKGTVEGTARLASTGMTYAIVGYTAVDPDRDLAILKVKAFDVKPLLLGDSDVISINTSIYVVGSPKGIEGTLSDGVISNIRPVINISIDGKTVKHRSPYFQMTAPISPGNSGGPVLKRNGRVIGVSVGTFRDAFIHEGMSYDAKDRFPIVDVKGKMIPGYYVDVPKRDTQNINFAIPVNDLKALLKRAGPLKPLSDLEVIN